MHLVMPLKLRMLTPLAQLAVNKKIIELYRHKENLETLNSKNPRSKIPTPLEFSLYVIDEAAKNGVENLNPHWQSQWGCCPFCTLDFDIIGHLETFEEDMNFIIRAMNWQVGNFTYTKANEKQALNYKFSL